MRALFYLVALAAPAATPALAQEAPMDLRDMVGARAGQAEGELVRRGYRNVRGEKGDDRSYTFWWNADLRQCVSIATMDGRYSSITATTPPDCRQTGSNARPGGSDRLGQDAPHQDDPPRHPNYASLDTSRLERECRMEASGSFDRRPGEIFVNAPIHQRNGYLVQGWYDQAQGKSTRFFNCRFDPEGEFISVN